VALNRPILAALAAGLLAWAAPPAGAGDLEDGNAAFNAGHYGDARQSWSAAAEGGNAEAAFNLGLLYDLGNGVPESAGTAFGWYRRAAEGGLGVAALDVGVMYDSGRGVPLDRTKAAVWYARAATLGEVQAAFNLGELYELGEGVPRNTAAAIAWYDVAAKAIPEAGVKASALAAHRPTGLAGALVPPMPAWPTGGRAVLLSGPHPAVQLVWTAPVEPDRVTYFVELQAQQNGRFNELAASYVATSALAVTLPGDGGNFAWRVYAVAADGAGYAPSPWMRFATASRPSGIPPRAIFP
jgi:TPR repeat protein